MDIFKKQLKKYFFLLAGIYVGICVLTYIVLLIYPDLLTIHHSKTSSSTVSVNYLITFFEYLTNLIILYQLNKDMKLIGQKSVPILILTFLYNTAGIIFYLILLFATNYKLIKLNYGTNS